MNQQLAEAVSLAMTVPTVIMAAFVVSRWGAAMRQAITRRPMTEDAWLIAGVVISFAGSVLDNIYWSLPWGASYLGLDCAPRLHFCGVYFNIFTRQGAGIVAAYCHLRAADLAPTIAGKRCDLILAGSSVLGCVMGFVLWLIK